MEPLRLEFTVACPAERAFELWARETSRWWPAGHSVSADPGLSVTFEARAGGRIYERTPDGDEHDWGEVLVWEPPHRLELPLAPALRPQRRDRGGGHLRRGGRRAPRSAIVHRGWERLGAAGRGAPRAQPARLGRA